jgi:hypothetical protein
MDRYEAEKAAAERVSFIVEAIGLSILAAWLFYGIAAASGIVGR